MSLQPIASFAFLDSDLAAALRAAWILDFVVDMHVGRLAAGEKRLVCTQSTRELFFCQTRCAAGHEFFRRNRSRVWRVSAGAMAFLRRKAACWQEWYLRCVCDPVAAGGRILDAAAGLERAQWARAKATSALMMRMANPKVATAVMVA